MKKTISHTRTARTVQRTHRKHFHLTDEQKYYIAQKIIGLVCIILGVVGAFILQSFPVMMVGVGIGIGCLFTKEKIIMVSDVYWNENPVKTSSNNVNKYTDSTCRNNKNVL